MANTGTPEVILRYDHEQDRDQFDRLFGRDFSIRPFPSDSAALEYLDQARGQPAAIVVLPHRSGEHLESALLAEARDRYPRLLKILLGDTIALNLLVSLLETQLIDRCFEQPVNPDLIRSHVLAAALTRPETPPVVGADNPGDGNKPAVLIVDDEPAATKYLARQLARMQDDFRVLCALSAEDAFRCIGEDGDTIAVVMTDQRMPGMHGKDLLDELRQSHPAIVRILTSAWGEVDVALDAVNEGRIFHYQTKPWHARDLLPLFRKALSRHRALVSARDSSRSQAEQHFAELRQQRHARLLDHLAEPVDAIAATPVVADFLDSLAVIRTLPANASHLRASQETPLEQELVRGFSDTVRRQLATLARVPGLQPPGQYELESALAETTISDPAAPPEHQTPLSMLCHSLVTLLAASGLTRGDVVIARDGDQLAISTSGPLRIYSHLLAPLTRLSRPLLEQQSALFLLHLTTRLLGGEISVTGGDQCAWITLRFAHQPGQRS
ncbi:MAG: response regulator [Pseudomonadota bacterium]